MTRKQQRALFIGLGLAALSVATALVLFALKDNVVFFYSPSDIVEKNMGPGQRLRLGGLVREGSLVKGDDGTVSFEVTDFGESLIVTYRGILPDLFREGQGVVAEGVLEGKGRFTADTVLAKHDETYMPPEVADALKRSGNWQGQGATESHSETYGQGSYP